MINQAITIGPKDHGRRMKLNDFDHAQGKPGYSYELGRGIVTVVDIPGTDHLAQVNAIDRQLYGYHLALPKKSFRVAHRGECKMLIDSFESERHPDISIYKTPPPEVDDVWAVWVPEIVIEVVSRESRHRDYEEKPEEYLQFGVKEFWILDAEKGEMLVHKRSRGRWSEQIIRPPEIYKTRLLPGFEFSCALVFEVAEAN
jgi:Uma2 family endonuclease